MLKRSIVSSLLAAGCVAPVVALSEEVKLPVANGDKGTLYVAPNVQSSGDTATAKGAVIGVQRPDGSSLSGGMDTSTGPRPTYSIGAGTGGDVSFTGGVQSDGKNNNGVKAGVTIKY